MNSNFTNTKEEPAVNYSKDQPVGLFLLNSHMTHLWEFVRLSSRAELEVQESSPFSPGSGRSLLTLLVPSTTTTQSNHTDPHLGTD